jgi:hypothetical protein
MKVAEAAKENGVAVSSPERNSFLRSPPSWNWRIRIIMKRILIRFRKKRKIPFEALGQT